MSTVTELKPKPTGRLIAGRTETRAPARLVKLAMDAWHVRKELDRLKDELAQYNEKLSQAIEPGTALEIAGVCRVTVAERQTVKVTDADALEQILGPRFEDLVEIRISHRPLPKLVQMATDGDHPLGKAVAQTLAIEHSVTVSYRPAK